MYLEDIFTVKANLSGLPAVSIPFATHSNGLPLGLQVMTKKFEEAHLFAFANYLEKEIVSFTENTAKVSNS